MKSISLEIPYLVISTQQFRDGRRQVHARTPFGCLDISSKLIDGSQSTPLLDITVEGDLDSWMLDQEMPTDFRRTLFLLAGKIAVLNSGRPVYRQCRLVINFISMAASLTVSGYLNLGEFQWRIEPDTRDAALYMNCA